MFLPQPEELQRTYGENATAAASIYDFARPAVYIVMAYRASLLWSWRPSQQEVRPGFQGGLWR